MHNTFTTSSSPHSTRHHHPPPISQHRPQIQHAALLRHELATRNTQDLHMSIIPQSRQQLRRDEEILARMLLTRDLDHAFVDHALVARVHALVDFVDDAEGRPREGL